MKNILRKSNFGFTKWCVALIAVGWMGGATGWGQTAQALPYSLTPGSAAGLTSANGWSQTGIGTDYGDATTPIKFDSTADVATLRISSAPAQVSFYLKGNGYAGGTFTLSQSSDGTTFTAVNTYTTAIPANSNAQFTESLLSATRYIRWTYTTKSSGNVGFGTIAITASGSTPPTLTAATGATVDNTFDVILTDNPAWRAAITSITVGGTTLASGAYSTTSTGKITFTPSASTLLQSSGSKSIVVIATGYNNATVTQSIGVGAASKLAVTTQPTAPASNGAVLATQPVVAVQDQYGNATTSTATVNAAVEAGTWTIGGTTGRAAISGTATFSGLTATSAAAVTGATITFSSGALRSATSSTFNIPVPPPANDLSSAPTSITVNGSAANGTTTAATYSTITGDANSKTDVWFSFTAPVSGTATLTATSTTSQDLDIEAWAGPVAPTSTTGQSILDGAGSGNTSEVATFTAVAGTTYFVRVLQYSGTAGSFTITATLPIPTISGAATATAFTTTYGAASSSQTFNISGANMSAGITVRPPSGFEVSTSPTFASNVGTSASPITVGAAGTIASTPIYVRLAATAAVSDTYNSQNVVLSSTGATAVNIVTASTGNSVTAKALTITAANQTVSYGTAVATVTEAGSYTPTGFANGDTSSVIGGAAFYSTTYTDTTAAGSNVATITPVTTSLTAANYSFTAANGNITVTAVVPSAPTIGTITPGNGQLSVAFTAPTSNGGASIADYKYSLDGGALVSVGSTSSPFIITGLTNDQSYAVRLYAVNSAGDSLASLAVNATPLTPSSPTITVHQVTFAGAFSTTYGTDSSTQNFTVSGSTLNDDLTVTAPTGFEISLSSGGEFAGLLNLTATSGSVASTKIYARLKATAAAGSYDGQTFSVSSTSADTQNVMTTSSGNVVDPAPLTITGIGIADKVYDRDTAATITGTAEYVGLQNGESESESVKGTPSASFATPTVGLAKPVDVTGYEAPNSNYTLTQPILAADITQKDLTVTGATVTDKSYDGTTAATITGATLDGVIEFDVVNLTGETSGTFANANVGTGIAVSTSMGITGADAVNYSLTPPTGLTGEITKATAEITFDPLPSGKRAGDVAFSSGATATVGTLSYSSSNPNVATVDVNGNITPVGAGVTAITATVVGTSNYNAATPVIRMLNIAGASAASGLIAGWDFQTTTSSGTAASAAPNSPLSYTANFGSGTIYLNGSNGSSTWTSLSSNPQLTAFAGTAVNAGTGFSTTTTAPACLTLANISANSNKVVFKFSMSGLKDLVVSYASQGTTTGFNTHSWETSVNGTEWLPAQSITSVPSTFAATTLTTITSLDNSATAYLRLTVNGASNASGNNRFDNIQLNATGISTPTIASPNGTFTGLSSTYGMVSAASATTVTVTGGSLTADILATAPTGFEVSNDGQTFGSTATFAQTSGFANGTLYLRLAADAPAGSPSGNVVLSTTGSKPVNVPVGASTVTAKALSVTADAQSKIYGDSDPTLTYTADGLVIGDTLAGSLSRAVGTAVGTYAISQGTLANPNYNISFTGANLVITAATLNPTSITVNPPLNLTYDGNPKVHTATAIGVTDFTYSYAGVSPTEYDASITAPTAAGTYTVTVTSSDLNYTGSKSVDFTITKATPPITVLPAALAITEGQALSASVLSGGTASVTGAFSWTAPSTVPAVGTATFGVTFTPTDTANYNTATTTVSVTVNPAGSTYAGWSGGATLDSAGLAKYAIGGASSLTANDGVKPTTALTGGFLVITAIVRTDNSSLTVVGQAVTDLANYASNTSVTVVPGVEVADQNGVPTGHKRKTFSVAQGSDARKFMRLSASLALSGTNTTVSVARDSGGATFLQVTGATAGSTSGGTATSDKRTVYYYALDNTSSPTFSGTAWPYVIVQGQLSAGAGVTATLTKNSSGVLLVNGLPAYQFGGDSGSTTASGVGGAWPAMRADGTKTTTGPSGTIQ